MIRRNAAVATVLGLGAIAALLASLLLAPVLQGGWCSDAPAGGTSVCGSFQSSLAGIETSLEVWMWTIATIGALTAVASVAASVAVRRQRDS